MVISSRKSGYVIGYGISYKDKYVIAKEALDSYCRDIFLVAIGCFIVGMFFSDDALTVLSFTGINTIFIGYMLAWEKIIKQK